MCRVIAAAQVNQTFALGRAYQRQDNQSHSWFPNGAQEASATALGNPSFYVLHGNADGEEHLTKVLLTLTDTMRSNVCEFKSTDITRSILWIETETCYKDPICDFIRSFQRSTSKLLTMVHA